MTTLLKWLQCATAIFALLIGLTAPLGTAQAQACTSSWSKSGYKSYSQIKNEVRAQLGDARIVRVELCGSGASAYFRVIALTGNAGSETRRQLRISAR